LSVRAAVIVAAAGSGRRMGSVNKAFLDLDGQPVLIRSIRPFLADPRVCCVVVTLDPATNEAPPPWLTGLDSRVCTVAGGAERDDSVRRALAAVPADVDVIVVHDAARPLVDHPLVARAIDEAAAGHAVTAAIPLADTIHQVDAEGRIVTTPDRTGLWRAQTPQAFPAAMLRQAHEMAVRTDLRATDDASLVARVVGPVHVIEGSAVNLKITVPADLVLARAILASSGQ
jgi:2-C-methyl-D-erythritol 4-phosphate cytidylyltransferase